MSQNGVFSYRTGEYTMNTKICPGCKQELPLSAFNKNKSKKDGHSSYCKECCCKTFRQYYRKNQQRYTKHAHCYKTKEREWISQFKKKCCRCGANHPAILQFHHIDGDDKDFTIGNAIGNKPRQVIIAEIQKCIVLCANCHAIEHYNKRVEEDEQLQANGLKKVVVRYKVVVETLGPPQSQRRRNKAKPTREELANLLWVIPTSKIAKDYGVSDNAVSKWAKRYGLPKPPRGYWAKQNSEISTENKQPA